MIHFQIISLFYRPNINSFFSCSISLRSSFLLLWLGVVFVVFFLKVSYHDIFLFISSYC